jgi:hypothetical protein
MAAPRTGSTDAVALLRAWEWAAEIRRRLVWAAERFDVGAENEFTEVLQVFDAEIEYTRRRGAERVWTIIEAFSLPNASTGDRTSADVERLRARCVGDESWLPRDFRVRATSTSRLELGGRRTIAEAARIAMHLVRLHYELPMRDVGLLEEPDAAERADMLATTWGAALDAFSAAVVWNRPRVPPRGRKGRRYPYTLPERLSEDEWRAILTGVLEGDDVAAVLSADRGTGARVGGDEAAYAFVAALTDVNVNTVRKWFEHYHPNWRTSKTQWKTQARAYSKRIPAT